MTIDKQHAHGIVFGAKDDAWQAEHRQKSERRSGYCRKKSEKHRFKDERIPHVLFLHADGAHGPDFPRAFADSHAQRIDDADEYDKEQHQHRAEGYKVERSFEFKHVACHFVHGLHVNDRSLEFGWCHVPHLFSRLIGRVRAFKQ